MLGNRTPAPHRVLSRSLCAKLLVLIMAEHPLSIMTFTTADAQDNGRYGVQWQFPGFTINCTATDLGFAQRILDFVTETRANPAYRDRPLGGGVYRHMDEKSIDLSSQFLDVGFTLSKIGEYDHGYELRFSSSSRFWIRVELHDQELDDFLFGLTEIIRDRVVPPEGNDDTRT